MEIKRTFDILAYQSENYNKEIALAYKQKGEWKTFSTADYIDYANNISYGLLALGVQAGDKIGIVSNNRPEWNFIDMGVSQIKAISVPLYPTISAEDYKFILNDAEIKYVFVGDKKILAKVQAVQADVPSLQGIYTFDEIENEKNWLEVVALGKKNPSVNTVLEIKNNLDENEILTLIYTSGTTGTPKGVMLTHKNIVSNVKGCSTVLVLPSTEKVLSFLPMCHIFERTVTYIYQYMGTSLYYAESIEMVAANLQEVKPYAFSTVPRLLEKVYDKIISKGDALTGIKRKLFFWAIDLGNEYELEGKSPWYSLQMKLADKLIFSKWREALGGNVKLIISGSAALQVRLSRIFTAAGIDVLEGYGLTETSPVITVNGLRQGTRKFGTVGVPLPGIEVKIAQDGEILCKGDNVMLGYYKRPDLTAEVIKDGWFYTGDIGVIENNLLRITDRKKEMFKTSGGKYIAPQFLENKFKESIYIEQIMIVGENQKHPSALIVPSMPIVMEWAKNNNIAYKDKNDLLKTPQLTELIRAEIQGYNREFGNWEQVKKFELVPEEWSVESGELTPTMKLKRKIITETYKNIILKMYE